MTRAEAFLYIRNAALSVGSSTTLVSDDEIGGLLNAAVATHSGNFPQKVAAEILGNPGVWDYPLPNNFQLEFSDIEAVECPAGGRDIQRRDKTNDFLIYKPSSDGRQIVLANIGESIVTLSEIRQAVFFTGLPIHVRIADAGLSVDESKLVTAADLATGKLTLSTALEQSHAASFVFKVPVLRFTTHNPALTEYISMSYTIPHDWPATGEPTIPEQDQRAVLHLAAGYVAQKIQGYYAQTVAATIISDSADYRTKASEWQTIAERQEGIYLSFFRLDPTTKTPPGYGVRTLKRKTPKVIEDDRLLFPYMA